ncbi:MAG: hypothetical protein EBS89_11770 [Proteobacteria bacterium]|nr:hypothetical protein [Pseudomonadota bacterium]
MTLLILLNTQWVEVSKDLLDKVPKDSKVLKVIKVYLVHLLDKVFRVLKAQWVLVLRVLLDMFQILLQKQQHHTLQHRDKQHLHLHTFLDTLMYLLMDLDLVMLIILQQMELRLY